MLFERKLEESSKPHHYCQSLNEDKWLQAYCLPRARCSPQPASSSHSWFLWGKKTPNLPVNNLTRSFLKYWSSVCQTFTPLLHTQTAHTVSLISSSLKTKTKARITVTPSIMMDNCYLRVLKAKTVRSPSDNDAFTACSLQSAQASVSEHPTDQASKMLSLSFMLTPVSCSSTTLPAAKMC